MRRPRRRPTLHVGSPRAGWDARSPDAGPEEPVRASPACPLSFPTPAQSAPPSFLRLRIVYVSRPAPPPEDPSSAVRSATIPGARPFPLADLADDDEAAFAQIDEFAGDVGANLQLHRCLISSCGKPPGGRSGCRFHMPRAAGPLGCSAGEWFRTCMVVICRAVPPVPIVPEPSLLLPGRLKSGALGFVGGTGDRWPIARAGLFVLRGPVTIRLRRGGQCAWLSSAK